jgi:hypothetical protein
MMGTLPGLKLPELIKKLAQEKEILVWNISKQWYEVIDLAGLETTFNALRRFVRNRPKIAADRLFAKMHSYFVLVRGQI